MSRCCMRCRAIPGACGLQRQCWCHAAEDRRSGPQRQSRIPETVQRSILAAQIGIDGAVEVARAHGVAVGAVHEIWREGRRGD